MKKFKTGSEIEISGTCYQGTIDISYSKIIEILGPPCCIGEIGVDKTQADWFVEGEIDGENVVATLYDWKQYDTLVEDITHWHIGGFNFKSVELIYKLLKY
jgi:hypothetical protein